MSKNSGQSNFAIPRPTPTGNMLVLMQPGMKTSTATKRLESLSGAKAASSSDYSEKSGAFSRALGEANNVYLEHLNVALVRPAKGADTTALSTSLLADSNVQTVRPEFYMYAYESAQRRYREWVREGLRILADGAPDIAMPANDLAASAAQVAADTENTWGIKAIKADQSPFNGKGVKLAVLDTGFDNAHPDYVGRSVTSESFVPGEEVQDLQGHGTHCIGTAAGPAAGEGHPRYGVAMEADIFVGKVLNNSGSGAESWILAGMEWALENGCDVISMSLGRSTQPGEQPDPLYEAVGRAALENNSVIIAAAGNDSARQFGFVAPVGAPANSPSIMAVGAVDNQMNVADFSCGGINANGGEIDICAPGVDVFSSVPMPMRYRRLPGTSMATPHVAGVAALLAQSDPNLRGQALWDALRRTALDIGLPMGDSGAGLVQAPTFAGDVVPIA